MDVWLTFLAIFFGLILVIVILIDANFSLIQYHDFSEMHWKEFGIMVVGFILIWFLCGLIAVALEITRSIYN